VLDWKKFRIYLKKKCSVGKAYVFLGYVSGNEGLYKFLRKSGYVLIFKEIFRDCERVKGNVDAELVLQTMIDFNNYDKAMIVTGDGDFSCLIKYLYENEKLYCVLFPNSRRCSVFLRRAARGKTSGMDFLREILEYKK